MVVSPHIQAPTAVHVPHVSLSQTRSFSNTPQVRSFSNTSQVRSFSNTQEFRSFSNPLGNNPVLNVPGQQVRPAPRPQVQTVPSTGLPLGTTVATANRAAVNGYTVGQVRQVQQSLHRLGYYNGDVDGGFGPNTQNALERYQINVGEPVTGTLTQGVLSRLGTTGK
jgi:peptidoglycan hydrolase-like protein with peptidoglycan-binding domain